MTLSDLASLGSFVSGLAVAVTLIFLVLQLRQTDKNQRAAIGMGRATRGTDLFTTMINPEDNRAITKAYRCAEDLNEAETYSYMFFCTALITNWEDTYFQHGAGTLDHAVWETEVAIMRANVSQPAFRAMWPLVRDLFGEEFRRYLETLIGQMTIVQPGSLAALYNAAVREQVAQAKPVAS